MINTKIKDIDMTFKTSNEVFSPKSIDKGTLAMLSVVDFKEDDKVMDLGCGYGVVGILASKIVGPSNVVMIDINDEAVLVSKENAVLNQVDGINIFKSDGFSNVKDTDFTIILSNPPYHEDFSVAKGFIEKGFNRLVVGGRIYMVTKRDKWYKNKLIAIFGGVKIWNIDDYFVFMAIKKDVAYSKVKNKVIKNNKIKK